MCYRMPLSKYNVSVKSVILWTYVKIHQFYVIIIESQMCTYNRNICTCNEHSTQVVYCPLKSFNVPTYVCIMFYYTQYKTICHVLYNAIRFKLNWSTYYVVRTATTSTVNKILLACFTSKMTIYFYFIFFHQGRKHYFIEFSRRLLEKKNTFIKR